MVVAAISLGAGTLTALTFPASFASAPIARQPAERLAIELIDQDFTIEANEQLRLTYRLIGDLGAIAGLAPTTTTTTTTTTTPTPTPTPDATPAPDSASTTTPATTAAPDAAPDATGQPVTETVPPTTVAPLPSLTVDVANFDPISEIGASAQLLGDQAIPGAFRGNIDGVRIVDARPAIQVLDATSALLTLVVPTDGGGDETLSGPDSLEFPTPGVHPIRVQVLVDGNLIGTHGTLIERRPGSDDPDRPARPVQIAIVTAAERVTASARDGQQIDPASDPAVDQQIDRVTDIVDAADAIDPPMLISIPPSILSAALDVGGAPAADLVARLDDEFVALSDIDLDVSSAVAAGLDDRYTQSLERGEETTTAVLRRPPSRVVQIVDAPLSGPGAQLLRSTGVRFLVMTPDRFDAVVGGAQPDTDRFVEVTLPAGGTLPILLTDPMSNEFSTDEADRALADATPTEWAIRTVADIVLDHRDKGQTIRRSRLIGLDTLAPPDPRLINALVEMAATTPDLSFVTPSELVGTTDIQRPSGGDPLTLPDVAGPDLTARVANIEATKLNLVSSASMLIDGDARTTVWIDQLDALLANDVTDAESTALIDRLLAESAEIRTGIVPPAPFTFTLTGRSDSIPIRIGNTSSQSLRVIVRLSSAKLTFPQNDREVVLRANDSTDIDVPVRARSNGTTPISIQLLTPLGEPLGEPVTFTARVNSLAGLGQLLTGAFLLTLATWWIANWRQRRSRAASVTEPGPDQ